MLLCRARVQGLIYKLIIIFISRRFPNQWKWFGKKRDSSPALFQYTRKHSLKLYRRSLELVIFQASDPVFNYWQFDTVLRRLSSAQTSRSSACRCGGVTPSMSRLEGFLGPTSCAHTASCTAHSPSTDLHPRTARPHLSTPTQESFFYTENNLKLSIYMFYFRTKRMSLLKLVYMKKIQILFLKT